MIGALLAGGASVLGGWLGNRSRSGEAQKNRDFQASQSSTAWQRGVKDMEAAGLNPALAYGSGPASTPSGSMAQQSDVVGPGVSSAMQMQRQKADLAVVRANATEAEARADLARGTNTALGLSRTTKGSLSMDLEGGLNRRIRNQIAGEEYATEAHRLSLPALRNSAAASAKMPYAAYARLLLQSGGSQVISGVAGGLGAATLMRRGPLLRTKYRR